MSGRDGRCGAKTEQVHQVSGFTISTKRKLRRNIQGNDAGEVFEFFEGLRGGKQWQRLLKRDLRVYFQGVKFFLKEQKKA